MLGFLCFMLAGIVGLLSFQLPLDKTLVLFPVFSGLFGLPVLVLQTKNKTELPIQTFGERKAVGFGWLRKTKAIIVGTVGGMFSGFLPGVGTSEIGSMATVDRNDRSFLIVMGAIVTSNVLLSFICLGLIGKGRSGVAVAAAQFISIGPAEILLICVVSLVCVAIGVLLTLFLSKRIISFMRRINYTLLSKIIIAVLVVLVFLFTGLIGLFVCALCCCLGLFANLVNVKRGLLMGVLMLPTILFFAGF
jgi:putative membrane protein